MFALRTLTLFDPDCASPKNGILVNLSAFALPQISELFVSSSPFHIASLKLLA